MNVTMMTAILKMKRMMMMSEIRYGKRPYTNTWLAKRKTYAIFTLTTAVPKLFCFILIVWAARSVNLL